MDFEHIAAGLRGAHPFAATVGVELGDLGEGTASAVLPAGEARANQLGDQHAGALYTVADSAAEGAFAGAFAEDLGAVGASAEGAELRLLAPARGAITAHAALEGDRRAALDAVERGEPVEVAVAVSLRDADEVEVATLRARWSLRQDAPAAE